MCLTFHWRKILAKKNKQNPTKKNPNNSVMFVSDVDLCFLWENDIPKGPLCKAYETSKYLKPSVTWGQIIFTQVLRNMLELCLFTVFFLKTRNQYKSCWIKKKIIFQISLLGGLIERYRVVYTVQWSISQGAYHLHLLLIPKLRLNTNEYLKTLHSWQKLLYCYYRAFIMITKCFCFLSWTFELFVINSCNVVLMWSFLLLVSIFVFPLEIFIFLSLHVSLILILHRPVHVHSSYTFVFMFTLEIS